MPLPSLTRARALVLDNRRMVVKLVVVTALMFAFGYALVPIYRTVCEALGINVLSRSELQFVEGGGAPAKNTQVDRSRTITVEFDANARGPWDFKPAQASIDVHPGEIATVMYRFRNRQNRTMAAQAFPSYTPGPAMAHFKKMECFCFTEHVLKPGESKEWPVVFVIDPKLPKDVRTITLSYTFFEVGGKIPAEPATSVRSTPAAGDARPL
ncbi:MAG TPA: cytochrome c oxidase assembly protein [Caldimonas sp.]|jgi:cytochrome c oxidase assembly protein subunit 11|nr:cytochrome c oxidase assembly protein [Caldimonas sp.]HEX2540842.1 cytochrome c oxidase assembly protein [Caldimonas sp.]